MANVLANAGRAILSARLNGNTQGVPQYIGYGTGTGTSAVTDTTLFTEDSAGSPAYARVTGTLSQATTTVTNDTYKVVGTLVANASKTITNAGVFDALTVGNLFVKGDFTGIALNLNDSITFTITLQFN